MTIEKKFSPFRFRIGTRKSQLALWQANWVKSRLEEMYPGIEVELVKIVTKGDKMTDVPLAKAGGKGLFVKEIEEALLDGSVDLAVHSMKDVPALIPEALDIAAIPEREDPYDALLSQSGDVLHHLPEGAKIGTSSLRRTAQLRMLRPDLNIEILRGNLDTRLRKLDEGLYDAIVVAAAGLNRLGWKGRVVEFLGPPDFLPAPGQGALAIETRTNDERVRNLIEPLEHSETRITITAERALQKTLGGGCQVPIAGHAVINPQGRVFLAGLVASVDGRKAARGEMEGSIGEAYHIGVKLAWRLLEGGAREILREIYGEER